MHFKTCSVPLVLPEIMWGDSAEELMLLNCGAGEHFWESVGLQEDLTSQP